jgi:molybdopterin molybdotransferase
MLDPRDAWRRLDTRLHPLPSELVPRAHALGRVLAEPVAATLDVPAADVSAMDGFAILGEVGGAPASALPVAGCIAAGDPPGRELAPGTALRILTGAPLPAGADRVIPVELAELDAQGRVSFRAPGAPGDHIRRRGEIVVAGAPLLPTGTVLGPGALSLLATHGLGALAVHRAPRVALVVTGDEVVPPSRVPEPGQLRDSHGDFLRAAGQTLGIEVDHLGIAPDRPEELRSLVERGVEQSDVLLTTGGVSMGELDHVEEVLVGLGFELLVTAVAIQPGKPFVAAHRADGKWVFGLPGNPGSVMVSYWLFVRPALRRLLGATDGFWHGALAAELAAPAPGTGPRDRFLAAEATVAAGRLRATPFPPRGSHDLAAYAHGNALLRLPAGAAPAPAGAPCEILPLADWRLR